MALPTPPVAVAAKPSVRGLNLNNGVRFVDNILSVVVPPRLKTKVITGYAPFDRLMGGDEPGVDPGFCTLFTGMSGGGKTTLMMLVADAITGLATKGKRTEGGIAIINQTEQSMTDVAKRQQKLGLKHGFVLTNFNEVEELIAFIEQRYLEKPKAGTKAEDFFPKREIFLFCDSLSGLRITEEGKKGRPPGQQLMEVMVVQRLISWAKQNFVIIFVLGHVNKSGKAAGKNTLVHDMDAHLHLGEYHSKEEGSYRAAEMFKDRGGPTGIEFRYTISQGAMTWEGERGSTTLDIGGEEDQKG